ncbi:DUF654-domain-containing protein, partial [Rhizodiscina lignyota]
MSSRALRRAQRELEEKKQLEQLKKEEEEAEQEDEEEEDEQPSTATSGFGIFAALDDDKDNEDAEGDAAQSEPESEELEVVRSKPAQTKSSKKKKKKKKRTKDAKQPELEKASKNTTSNRQVDEIDQALRQLKLLQTKAPGVDQSTSSISKEQQELFELLSVDTQHLHAANEMRRLFGRAAMEDDRGDAEAGATGRRRGRNRGGRQVGIAGAVAGGRSAAGRLAGVALRRNIFIQGKEEWPRGTAAGLGMELIEKNTHGECVFKYVHSPSYQEVQRQFQSCVRTMDHEHMVHLLRVNPYHISTLLQVSDMAKQERDHTASGDLLERALFTFGRAIHSTFSKRLSEGTARLEFRRPENREFWLAGWRYIDNLSMRSTWRTVLEWAKLLFSLAPYNDPYQMRLVIDQYAIRARQPQQLIDLMDNKLLRESEHLHKLPNIQYSAGLALIQTKNPSRARQALKAAIESHPWIAARLFQELNLEPVPPSIWGRTPPTLREAVYTELYAGRAKDIWNTPEATSLLMEVARSAAKDHPSSQDRSITSMDNINLNIARHVIMTDNREFIALIPSEFTRQLTSVSDPLPPEDDLNTYQSAAPG